VLDKTPGYFSEIRISPDGEHIAYADHPVWGDNRGNLALVDRAGKKTTLAKDYAAIQGVAWAPGGKEIWYTASVDGAAGGSIYASDLAGRSRVVYASISPIELFDIAADGRVLVGRHQQQREVLGRLAGFAEARPLLIPGEASTARGISADGRA